MDNKKLKVGDVMSAGVSTLGRNDKLSIAEDLMKQERIRHLPVIDDDGDLCGIVTQRDMFRSALVRALGFGSRAEDQILNTIFVKEVMTDKVQTTTPGTPLAEAAKLMIERKIGCLPVIDGDRLVGMLSEGDFAKLMT
jgi:CBS domain-containing membrane protein